MTSLMLNMNLGGELAFRGELAFKRRGLARKNLKHQNTPKLSSFWEYEEGNI